MKKTLLICCVLLMALMVSAVAEDMDFGIWKLSHYVDEFKLPTDEAYITNSAPIEGTFCNSAVDDALLNVSILMDEYDFAFVLYEYGDSKVKNSFSDARYYEITMLDDNREKTYLSGKMSADGGDRIILGDDAENTVLRALKNNASLSFYIAEANNPTTNYLFTIGDTDGIGAAVMALETSFNERDYQAAVKLYNEGRYKEALEAFLFLGEYKDSAEWEGKYQAMKYAEAEELLAAKKYATANKAFIEADDYSNAKSRVGEPYYVQAEELLAAKDYAGANEAFIEAGDYSDAKSRVGEPYYVQAEELLAAKDYETAIAAFEKAGAYSDAKERIKQICYTQAEEFLAAKEYDKASKKFAAAGDYSDAKERIGEPYYMMAEVLLSEKKFEDANAAFKNAGNYKDSSAMAKECYYLLAADILAEGHYGQAVEVYRKIEDYKDVATLLATNRNLSGAAKRMELAKEGNIVTLGAYEQDGQKANGKEPIEWIVLKVSGKNVMLFSKHVLDVRPMHHNENNVLWKNSDLRKWLNDEFYNEAFTAEEKAYIQQTTLQNRIDKSGKTSSTDDYVFLLSREQIEPYERADFMTDMGVTLWMQYKADSWWTRTPTFYYGESNRSFFIIKDIIKMAGGEKRIEFGSHAGADYRAYIRPAVMIDLNAVGLLDEKDRVPYDTLEKGDKNDKVKKLQEFLIDQGYLSGKADGDFGNKTVQAVKAAQKAFGMEETGVADDVFQKKLYEAN